MQLNDFSPVWIDMCLEANNYCARVVALLAIKRFLASVCKNVVLHPIRVYARVAALLTCIELLSSILELMPLEIASLRAIIVTQLKAEFLPPPSFLLLLLNVSPCVV